MKALQALFMVLFLHDAVKGVSNTSVGQSFYLPDYDLLGDQLYGGYHVYQKLPPSCISTKSVSQTDSSTSFFENTESSLLHQPGNTELTFG